MIVNPWGLHGLPQHRINPLEVLIVLASDPQRQRGLTDEVKAIALQLYPEPEDTRNQYFREGSRGIMRAVLLYLAVFWPPLPDRRHDWAETLGQGLLAQSAGSRLLVVDDPELTSLVMAAHRHERRPDHPIIVPAQALYDATGYGHQRLQRAGLLPDSGFLGEGAIARWQHDLRMHAPAGDAAPGTELDAFILWDYVSANLDRRPIAFAGVDAPWLLPRAHRSGLTLHYPGGTAHTRDDAWPIYTPDRVPRDPGGIRTVTALILPLSAHARAQASAGTAQRLALELQRLAPENPDAVLAGLEAEARLGDRDHALNSAVAYLSGATEARGQTPVEHRIEAAFARYEHETAMLEYLKELDGQEADWDRRNTILAPLWQSEEFILLAAAYEQLRRHYLLDLDAVYQLAAVRAQLGEWDKVHSLLALWQGTAGISDAERRAALFQDGRFAHYLRLYGLSGAAAAGT